MEAALEMIHITQERFEGWDLRVGIHYGPVSAGIVGERRYLFDVWGDTVNVAARIESSGVAGSVNLSSEAAALARAKFRCSSKGLKVVKGRGELELFCVESKDTHPR